MNSGILPASETDQKMPFSLKWLIPSLILLIILVVVIYSGVIRNGFVDWDDPEYVVENKLVRDHQATGLRDVFSTSVSLNYHPLTILSLRLNNNDCKDCLNGISAKPFLTWNLILHALNTILVFFLILKVFRNNLIAGFITAALFAVHPMHVESVAWISARKDVLNCFFFLSGIIVYLIYISTGRKKVLLYTLAFVLFVFACLSKATAVVFPVMILLMEFFIYDDEKISNHFITLKKIFSRRIILPLLPFFAVSVFFGLMAISLQNGNNFMGMLKFLKDPHDVVNTGVQYSILHKMQVASYGFFVYLFKFLIPVKLSAFYPYPAYSEISGGNFSVILWISLIGFLLLLFLVMLSLKKTALLFFSYGIFLTNLIMVLQFISVGRVMLAERYTYLPYIGLAILPAYYISRSSSLLRRVLIITTGLFVFVLVLLARNQVRVWHDTGSLWTQVINRYPNLELARNGRAKYYLRLSYQENDIKKKRMLEDQAITDFEVSIKQNSTTPDVYEGYGLILLSRNDPEKALQMLSIAIKINPRKGRTYYNRAIVYDILGRKVEALKDYRSARICSPEMTTEILRNSSVLYIETGRYQDALADLDELITTGSKEFLNYYNRAFVKLMLKNIDGAIEDYRNALRINPGDKATQEHLKVLLDAK